MAVPLMADGAEVVSLPHSRGECKAAQRRAALKAVIAGVLTVVAVIAVCSAVTNQSVELKQENDEGSMKNINRLLKKLDQLSATAHKGEERDKHADVQVKELDDSETDSDAPSGVKHGIAHVSNALKEAEDAEKSLKSSDSEDSERKSSRKRAVIAAKMKALQEQILSDFSKVTGFGKSAGFIPPVKLPHV